MTEDQWLLQLARESVTSAVSGQAPPNPAQVPAALLAPGASFVTLTRHGHLRGCIGTLAAHKPLWQDVRDNACGAALRDPRFPALRPDELGDTAISLSLLDPAESLDVGSRAGLLAQLEPGRHGLTIRADGHQATFLPSVWAQLPDPDQFLDHLKAKAGLATDFPDTRLQCERYTVRHLNEH